MSLPSTIWLQQPQLRFECSAHWQAMQGDARQRHCALCNKTVYNLSAMPADDAAALLATNGGQVCVRFLQHDDGRVKTREDLPLRFRTSARQWPKLAGTAAGALLLATIAACQSDALKPELRALAGTPVLQGEVSAVTPRDGSKMGDVNEAAMGKPLLGEPLPAK
ncbi:hypothetical protein SAMN02745857_00151 [Andreprevotia lacus DSM 23236]|jgi:hypothetical protein|uniref:Uncharacterized protein n=1 Tax=Andreprevotia lacus DSM 23236 TaxID=1121001 RepID=A0A1W1WX35_9NEIS|nr:hypothetical protein [Andreprevotia lacus]SMC16289.1 hypothetical protein SAMN02745857_00151 [Andreprevotia lacus DSM 23236]